MTFDAWKLRLRKDCDSEDKLSAFDSMPDFALKLLWEKGLTPTIEAIAASIQPPNQQPI